MSVSLGGQGMDAMLIEGCEGKAMGGFVSVLTILKSNSLW